MNKRHSVYIITNKKDGVLYIGVTNNLKVRIWDHRNKMIEGFSRKYNLTKLVYVEFFNLHVEAISREKQLKTWKRAWKIELIEKQNPDWLDLWEELF